MDRTSRKKLMVYWLSDQNSILRLWSWFRAGKWLSGCVWWYRFCGDRSDTLNKTKLGPVRSSVGPTGRPGPETGTVPGCFTCVVFLNLPLQKRGETTTGRSTPNFQESLTPKSSFSLDGHLEELLWIVFFFCLFWRDKTRPNSER